jgi:hypothetical protein
MMLKKMSLLLALASFLLLAEAKPPVILDPKVADQVREPYRWKPGDPGVTIVPSEERQKQKDVNRVKQVKPEPVKVNGELRAPDGGKAVR